MIKKNIIDEGVEDSELDSELDSEISEIKSEKKSERRSEKKSEKIPNQVSNKVFNQTNGISINVGDTLEVKSIGDGEIVLAIPSQEQVQEESEENSDGSYMVR